MKTCYKCRRGLPTSSFARDRSRKDGLTACCKNCCNQQSAAWRAANPGEQAVLTRRWRRANRGHIRVYERHRYAIRSKRGVRRPAGAPVRRYQRRQQSQNNEPSSYGES